MDPEATLEEARQRIEACDDAATLKDVLRDYVGKKGAISAMLAEIPKLDPADRKAHGQKANALKQSIQALADDRQAALDARELDAARRADGCSFSLAAGAAKAAPFSAAGSTASTGLASVAVVGAVSVCMTSVIVLVSNFLWKFFM